MNRNKKFDDTLTEILGDCYEIIAIIEVLKQYLEYHNENSLEIANACCVNDCVLDKFSKLIRKIDETSVEIHTNN